MTERTEVRARTVQGFCRAYGIGRTATYELISEGRLQAKKFGKRTLIMEDSAKAWLASLTHIPAHIGHADLDDHRRPEADGIDGKSL